MFLGEGRDPFGGTGIDRQIVLLVFPGKELLSDAISRHSIAEVAFGFWKELDHQPVDGFATLTAGFWEYS